MTQQAQWQVAGNAAEAYERFLVPAIFEPWATELVQRAALRSGERVLDVGCGTGIVARLASAAVGPKSTVVGLDPNPGMLAVARTIPAPSGGAITWREGSATALPFPDAAFDAVLSQQVLQFISDKATALKELHRVLAPGGRVALSVWRPIEHSPGFAALAEALYRHISPDAAAMMHAPFALGEADVLQALLTDAQFQDVVVEPAARLLRFASAEAFVRQYVAGSPLAGLVGQASEPARTALLGDTQAALQAWTTDTGLAFPIETHLVRASV